MRTQISQVMYQSIPAYVLHCGKTQVYVAPEQGMNLCRIDFDGYTVLDTNNERRLRGATWGMPILYPTPNRISGGGIHCGKEVLPMIWQGEHIQMHGAARFMRFEVTECRYATNYVSIIGVLNFTPGNQAYSYFPFKSCLSLEIRVFENRVEVSHTVQNLDKKPLPFGLGYHPFFNKLGKIRIRTGARSYYITDEDKIPSGVLQPADGIFDLSAGVSPEAVDLDHVYTDLPQDENSADIFYDSIGLHLALKATPDFSHLVVFTPPNMSYFCLENQTCCTDCHNLSATCAHTGLRTVMPDEVAKGTVTIEVSSL